MQRCAQCLGTSLPIRFSDPVRAFHAVDPAKLLDIFQHLFLMCINIPADLLFVHNFCLHYSLYTIFPTSENTLREFPLVIATVAKVSRKRGLWLVVRVKKGDTRRYLHFYSFSSAASYVGMIQIRYTGLGDTANSQPDPSGSPVCLFSFFDKIYYILSARKSQVCTQFRT